MGARVLVVGAGPAGTACAIELSRAGAEVVVIDKATFPRDKCCGDGLTTSALRLLEGLSFDVRGLPGAMTCTRIEMRTPRGRSVALELPGSGTYAVTVPRRDLDHALVAHCRGLGIEVREGDALVSVPENSAAAVQAETTSGVNDYDYVVAADGMWSPTRRMIQRPGPEGLGEWHAFRQYVGGVTGTSATTLHVWFEPDMLPGYAWSFPLPGNRANVGFGVRRDPGIPAAAMKAMWSGLLGRPHIARALGEGAAPEGRHLAWPIPARIDTAMRSAGRVLFVGDAVGATDILTGEGIGQAIETGTLAARAIAQGATPADVRARYSRLLDRHLLADHRMSRVLGSMISSPAVTEGVLALVGTNSWTRRNFARWMFEDEPRAVLLTPRRWHRGFLARPGAWAGTGRN